MNPKRTSSTTSSQDKPIEEVVDSAIIGGASESALEPFGSLAGAAIAAVTTGLEIMKEQTKPTKKRHESK